MSGNTQTLPTDETSSDAIDRRCSLTRDNDGRPFRWRDPDGIVHATVEWPLDPEGPQVNGETRCKIYLIRPHESWTGNDRLTCETCAAIESDEETGRGGH